MADSMDLLVQRIVQDERPIALRKKRRRSIASPKRNDADRSNHPSHEACPPPTTPAKVKKRVRFSDPGPEISSPSSTGITPFVHRTTLQPSEPAAPATPRRLDKQARRSASLPLISASLSHEPSSPVEIHFEPLRQLLTPRTRRQLGRNGLSEEMNSIEAEKKIRFRQEQQIEELREELDMMRQRLDENTKPSPESLDKIRELEEEILELKSERDRVPDNNDETSGLDQDDVVSLVGSGIYEDPDCILVDATPQISPTPLLAEVDVSFNRTDQSNQTEMIESSMSDLENHIKKQTAYLLQTRLDLERLYPGETSLPLTPPANGDCSPLLAAMLTHLHNSQSTIRSTTASLRASEIQESNLRAQFNGVLANLDTTREAHAQLLKGAKAGAEKYAQARERIASLENEVDEGNRSSEKLKTALDSYREEVKSLESLVTRVEKEGNDKLDTLRSEMDEAVADLECWVAAETRGRREAEEQLDVRTLQIRTLESGRRELSEAIAEKQRLVRGLEEELDQVREDKEEEVGRLNVKVGSIEESLASAREDIAKLETEKALLVKKVVDGRQKEMKKVAELKEELRKAVRGVEGVVGGWEKATLSKGEGVTVAGLLTPRVEGGRFRDVATDTVEGAVKMQRGKSRRSRKVDSGIGILEEGPEDEDST